MEIVDQDVPKAPEEPAVEPKTVKTPTPVSEFLVSIVKRLTSDDHTLAPSIPLFIGGNEGIHTAINETGIAYALYGKAKDKKKKEEMQMYLNKFNELKAEHFPDLSDDEVGAYCMVYLQFVRRYLSRSFAAQDELVANDLLVNRFNGPKGPVPFINPITPKVRATATKRDRMRRRHNSGATQNIADSFTMVLNNSIIVMKVKRPARVELINLINDIEMKLRYFGERWVINSINLERAGISRLIVDFVLDRVTEHSVEGILSPAELKEIILSNDIDVLAALLLENASPRGVYYNLNCLNNKCNHSELILIDPHDFIHVNDADMSEEQKDMISQMLNHGRKFKMEEIRKLQNKYKFKGVDVDTAVKLSTAINAEPTAQFTLGVPSVGEYFATFDLMSERYDPTIKKYAMDYPETEKFRKKRSEFLGAIRMGEFVHWVKNYITFGDPQTETPDEIDDRGGDARGFEEGALDIFADDDEAYWKVFGAIHEKVPYMTNTFVGILNSECPKCGNRHVAEEEGEKLHEIVSASGFTPIDMVTNFFDLTRMLINELGEQQRVQEEITS